MIELYNKRLEEARLELAGNIRAGIKDLIQSGYKDHLDMRSGSAGFYYLENGHLYGLVETGSWPPLEKKEITPEELHLEKYDAGELLRIASRIEAAKTKA